MVAGPNGAGKTTFVAHVLAAITPSSVFVNADDIAKERWPADPAAHAYQAAAAAADTRAHLLGLRRPFIAETVFSHRSKVDLIRDAQAAGYLVVMHVLLVPEDLAVKRVRYRVEAGGHDVPEDKIRQRYRRLWGLVAEGIIESDSALIYNNAGEGPRIVATVVAGQIIGSPTWPAWTPAVLSSSLHREQSPDRGPPA